MKTEPLSAEDDELIEFARETNWRAFDPDFFDGGHIVAAAVRTVDGELYDGVSLPGSTGKMSHCGEPAAMGAAISDGYRHDEISTCVAVAHPRGEGDEPEVVPPCGNCRGLLADFDEDIRVIVPVDDELRVARAIDLLPTRTW